MKNAIIYFYDLEPTDIRISNKGCFFNSDDKKYFLEETNRTIEEIYELYDLTIYLLNYNIQIHNIILNKFGNFLSDINEKKYVLLEIKMDEQRKINIDDILIFSGLVIPLKNYQYILRNNWKEMWSKRIDYMEYQIDDQKFKYHFLAMNIDYFIGLAENGIQLLNLTNNNKLTIAHKKISKNTTLLELYNPLNLVIDSKVRDICEYYKELIIYDENNFDINKIINGFSKDEILLFFIRLLYFSMYFNLYDELLINNEENLDKIDKIINGIQKYENELRKIYYQYEKKVIPEINWLKKTSY